jgi:hypothetical protein
LDHLTRLGRAGNRYELLLSKKSLLWVTAGICALLLVFLVTSLYGFLAVNHPIGEGVLVVEGWIPAETLAEAIHAFRAGDYKFLVVVGGLLGNGSVSGNPTTYADLAASRLEQLGFDSGKLIKISVPPVTSERTLTGAADVKLWLERSGTNVCCVDIFTTGVHARRSWILSRYAFGDRYRVGIIAGPEARFNPKYWFFSRTGTWLVVRNLTGYVYYKLWICCAASRVSHG